jgi:hypothetical protein
MGAFMRTAIFAAALVAFGAQLAWAAPRPIEDACPTAAAPIDAYRKLADQYDGARLEAAARTVVNAFKICATSSQSTQGQLEPYVHYDNTRAAQFEVAVGRALVLQGKFEDAQLQFIDARRLAETVVLWSPNGRFGGRPDTDTAPLHSQPLGHSMFHDTAATIMKAADDELAKLKLPPPIPAVSATP